MKTPNLENLTIGDDPRLEINIDTKDEEQIDSSLCLVGCFMQEKKLCSHIMKNRISLVWKPFQGVTITNLATGRFLF
ncbi:hypothetical protein JHK82_017116 [Glycine max]|nr:hypothetical protein JHK82_017116 [Glycine max]